MTEQPEQPDATPTPAVDDADPAANLFDASEAPQVPVPPTSPSAPRDQTIPDEISASDTPDAEGVGPLDPANPEVAREDAKGEDAGPDWEQLAALDPRTGGELLEALHVATASRNDYLESLQRKQAEFENFRRRMQGQAARQRVAGHADVAGRVLEVLDDFDRTLASIATTADEGVVKGVSLVRDKLLGALREVGLERVEDQGAPFDPNRHEAVQQVAGDGIVGDDGTPVVAQVLRPGYVLGDRVLRAAMVAVAQ